MLFIKVVNILLHSMSCGLVRNVLLEELRVYVVFFVDFLHNQKV